MIYSSTTKQTLTNKIFDVTNLKPSDFKVVKLEDEDSDIVIFQIILPSKSIKLNDLFEIGVGGLNPSFMKADHGMLITFHVTK